MTSKKKYFLLRIFGFFLLIIYVIALTAIFVAFGAYELWKDIPQQGISSFNQWWTIILYRILLYLAFPFLFSIYRFDKRIKWVNRLLIWFNFFFFIFLLTQSIYYFLALNLLRNNPILSALDSLSLLVGYIFTLIKKQKIEFDSTGAIIDKYSYKK